MYYLPASFPHCIDMSCRLQYIKGFFCAVQVPDRGFRARLHEQGAVLCSGEGLAGVFNAAQGRGLLAGGCMSVCLPAPVPDQRICCSTGSRESEHTSKAEQSVLEKLREMPPSSLSPSLKAGSLHCCGEVSRAKIN